MKNRFEKKQFVSKFRVLSKNSACKSYLILLIYLSTIFLSITAGCYLVNLEGVIPSLLIFFLVLLIGTRLRGLNNIIHECTHFSFSHRSSDNIICGRLAAAFVFNSFDSYRKEHISHHRFQGDYNKDQDFINRKFFKIENKITPMVFIKHLLTPVIGIHLYKYFKINLSSADGFYYLLLKVVLLSLYSLFFYYDFLSFFLFILVPYVFIYTAINYWTDCIDHAGILLEDDEVKASRNFIVPLIVRVLLFPRNNCFHLIHHLFPNVPSQHFDKCHRELMEEPAYRAVNI